MKWHSIRHCFARSSASISGFITKLTWNKIVTHNV
jgi:hypothetical protein